VTTPAYHRPASIKSHHTLLAEQRAEQRQRLSLYTADELRQRERELAARKQADEAHQRRIGYMTSARPDSVALVRYSNSRGMSRQTMDRIWGRVFVDAVLIGSQL
jgi:hypothetical protein